MWLWERPQYDILAGKDSSCKDLKIDGPKTKIPGKYEFKNKSKLEKTEDRVI